MTTTKESKVVLVTGCSDGGIGAAMCKEFAAKGFIVYATTRSMTSMNGLVGDNIRKLVLDVTNDESVKTALDEIYAAVGHIDILFSCAGVACVGPVMDISFERTRQVMETNFFGTVRLVNAVLPRMAERKSGLIVPVGSILGELGTPFFGVYNASKAAVHAYAETLALECQPLHVKVMLISPGSVISNISNNEAKMYNMPEGSLYKDYGNQITRSMFISQKSGMATDKFAKQCINKILAKDPPRYFTTGGMVTTWNVFKWLPRTFALQLLWKDLTKP